MATARLGKGLLLGLGRLARGQADCNVAIPKSD